MSKCNPAVPLAFRHALWWEGQEQVPIVEAGCEGRSVGYFKQGSDGQWWWFAMGDEFGQCSPLAASNIEQVRTVLLNLNAGNDLPEV